MKIQELRIGNIISHLGQTAKIIGFASTGYIKGDFYDHELILDNGSYEASLNHCNGVEISKEILLKCGFDTFGDELTIKLGHRFFLKYVNGKVYTENTDPDEDTSVLHQHIIYLHQLQNLYFALTGQELNTSGL